MAIAEREILTTQETKPWWRLARVRVSEDLSFGEGISISNLRDQREIITQAFLEEMAEEWRHWKKPPTEEQQKLIGAVVLDTLEGMKDRLTPGSILETSIETAVAEPIPESLLRTAFGLNYHFSKQRKDFPGYPAHEGGFSREQVLSEIKDKYFYPDSKEYPYLMVMGLNCRRAGFVEAEKLAKELGRGQNTLYRYLARILGPRPLRYCPRLWRRREDGRFESIVVFPLLLVQELRKHYGKAEEKPKVPVEGWAVRARAKQMRGELMIGRESWMDLDKATQKRLWDRFQAGKRAMELGEDNKEGGKLVIEGLAARSIMVSSLRGIVAKAVRRWEFGFWENLTQVGQIALVNALNAMKDHWERGSYVHFYCRRYATSAIHREGWKMAREKGQLPFYDEKFLTENPPCWVNGRWGTRGNYTFQGSPVENQVCLADNREFLLNLVETAPVLSPKEVKVLKLRFGLGKGERQTQAKTAKGAHVPLRKIRLFEEEVLNKLREEIKAKGLTSEDFIF